MKHETVYKNSCIGVIDSGVGGITVLESLVQLLPNENYLYIGDTLNNPYGDKTNDEIRQVTNRIIDYLLEQNVKALVIACNTINSFMYREILSRMNRIVIGVIFPTVDHVNSLGINKVGIIATSSTIKNGAYQKMLEKDVYPLETPNFVKIVESKRFKDDQCFDEIKSTIKPLTDNNIEALVLGCTHYPFLRSHLERIFDGIIVESGFVTALDLKERLENNNLINDDEGSVSILVTKDQNKFNEIIKDYVTFDYTIEEVKI